MIGKPIRIGRGRAPAWDPHGHVSVESLALRKEISKAFEKHHALAMPEVSFEESQVSGFDLGDHLKTGHTLSVQNRPTGLAEDVIVLPRRSVFGQGVV
jgi:hypothetical protein